MEIGFFFLCRESRNESVVLCSVAGIGLGAVDKNEALFPRLALGLLC